VANGVRWREFRERLKMLVCQCNVITSRDVEKIVRQFLDEDPWQLIVPAKVYHEMGKRGLCCGCFPNVVDIIIEVTEKYHLQNGADAARLTDVQERFDQLRTRHRPLRPVGGVNERRSAGHRAA
jgi:bacterioferritin-associated ferredoxin